MSKTTEFGPGKEFFSEWHRDAYVEGCERELVAANARVGELEDLGTLRDDDPALVEARGRVTNAQKELKRLGAGQKAAQKRPAGRAKDTR